MEGHVKFFDPVAQYGFVAILDEHDTYIRDFFFHSSVLLDCADIRRGELVTFWIDDDLHHPSGWRAVDISRKLGPSAKLDELATVDAQS